MTILKAALKYCNRKRIFIHPFDDLEAEAAQATLVRVLSQIEKPIDFVIVPIR